MALPQNSFDLPVGEKLVEQNQMVNSTWFWFFRGIFERLFPLGFEQSFILSNGQTDAFNIDGLKFNSRGVSQALIEYCIQRVTTGTGAVEEIECGTLCAYYKPSSESWAIFAISEHLPTDAGITFSITADGQVQYTSDTVLGTPSISRIFFRVRTLAGKHQLYSSMGAR